MDSDEIIMLANLCQIYKGVLPSQLMDITDPYTSYCLNEAVGYIIARLENGEKPIKKINKTSKNKQKRSHYSSFSQLYEKYDN